jgi:acyl-CoA synthetase (AMP-forming)/AMP-acid ligase II
VTLGSLLEGGPDEIVVYCGDSRTTRGELRERVATIGAQLDDVAGRAVGVCMPNTADAIAAWFAVWQAGAAFAPLNPRVPDAELEQRIAATGVVAVVGPNGVERQSPNEPRSIMPGDAIVQFTSGTTGPPKPVPLRHDRVLDLIDRVVGSLRGGRTEAKPPMPNLVPVSLSLWAGIYQVLFAFRLGAPVILMEQFTTSEFARLVAQYEIRSSVLPPAAMVMLSEDAAVTSLAPLRFVRSITAPLSPAHAQRFHERFGVAVLNGYGQTELGGEVIGWTAADWKEFGPAKLGAVGRPHAGIHVRVVEGELRVSADGATWISTGDLGRVDDDGFVWIDGRVSDMINRGGMKVFPDEVEERIRALPGVRDVAVVGVPDERLGEVPWAFVVGSVGFDELAAWCREALAAYKVPVGMTGLPSLPRNEIGKLLRRELVPRAEPG